MGGGALWPGRSKTVCRFHRIWARFTKIHDFVPFNVWQDPVKSFLEFFLKLSKKWTSKISGGPRACRENWKKYIFFAKIHTFSGWIWIVDVLSFLLRYIFLLLLKIWNFDFFFAWKFSFLTFVIRQPVAAKLDYIGGCLGCLWKAKD